jgi:hypothetical protein|tara:strand:- start:2940 stop:3704 length:765 start_codon:yes stop_codon:yes gene_type:complete
MFNKIKYICIFIFATGCSTPLGKFNKQKAVVSNINQNIDQNKAKEIESGRTFVYAADQALQKDPDPSKHSRVAKQMTTRSITALGPPQAENAIKSNKVVDDLLSDDPKQEKEGQKLLQQLDAQLIAVQNQNKLLENKLSSAQAKLEATNQQNALMATKYQSLMQKVYWIVGSVILLAVLGIAIKVTGVIAPFTMPATGATSTLLKLVKGIQSIRNDHGAEKNPVLAQIDNHLKGNLDEKDRWRINQAKKKLNMI